MHHFIFVPPSGKGRKELSSLVQRLRKVGNIPPPYPNGWYEVMRSCDLPKKAVKAVSMIGQNFAVFRGEDGKVCWDIWACVLSGLQGCLHVCVCVW